MSEAPHPVKPLGIFGVVADQWEFERLRSQLAALAVDRYLMKHARGIDAVLASLEKS